MRRQHTKEYKGKLLYVKFYLDLGWLKTIFMEIAEGWKHHIVYDPSMKNYHSFEDITIEFMERQAYELFQKNEGATLESISDYVHSMLNFS